MLKSLKIFFAIAIMMYSFNFLCFASTDEEVIDIVKKEGIMQGTGNGFESEKILTRAEMTVIAAKIKGIEDEAVTPANFSDVTEKHWANSYIGISNAYGIVNGVGQNKFEPDREVTLAETVTMIIRTIADYEEIDKSGSWPNNYINYAKSEGLLKDINLTANQKINRIKTARIIANLISSPNWESSSEENNKDVVMDEDEKDKIIPSVVGIGVILSIASSEDGYTLVELATPGGIKEYTVHGSELIAGTVLPGTYIDFWLSGTRMWDIIAEKVIGLNENDKMAKIYHFGDGTIKLINKGSSEPVVLDRKNIIVLKCSEMKLTEGLMEFEDLEIGLERDIKLVSDKSVDTYDKLDGDEVFYHTKEIDGEKVVVAIVYVK